MPRSLLISKWRSSNESEILKTEKTTTTGYVYIIRDSNLRLSPRVFSMSKESKGFYFSARYLPISLHPPRQLSKRAPNLHATGLNTSVELKVKNVKKGKKKSNNATGSSLSLMSRRRQESFYDLYYSLRLMLKPCFF